MNKRFFISASHQYFSFSSSLIWGTKIINIFRPVDKNNKITKTKWTSENHNNTINSEKYNSLSVLQTKKNLVFF